MIKRYLFLSWYIVTFGIGNNKADGVLLGRTLHQIGLQPKPRLTGAGTADNQHVFISRCAGVSRAAVHGQAFRLGENDVVLEGRINVGGNVGGGSPAGRAVFLIVPKFFCVPAFDIYSQPHGSGYADATELSNPAYQGAITSETLYYIGTYYTNIVNGNWSQYSFILAASLHSGNPGQYNLSGRWNP